MYMMSLLQKKHLTIRWMQSKIVALFILAIIFIPFSVRAGGFWIVSQSNDALALAEAGVAATAEDATTNYYNPAGLVRVQHIQGIISPNFVTAVTKFRGSVTTPEIPFIGSKTLNGRARTSVSGILPPAYLAIPLAKRLVFGFGITEPYGLASDYNYNSVLRYESYYSEIISFNFNPNLAFAITPQLSVGIGIVEQYVSLKELRKIFLGPNPEGKADTHMEGWSRGMTAGVLWMPSEETRLGLSYRSGIRQSLTGSADVAIFDQKFNLPIHSRFPTPGDIMFSVVHKLDEHWEILASVFYELWHQFDAIKVSVNSPIGKVEVVSPQNFKDSLDYALGFKYRDGLKWVYKAGINFIGSPTPGANHMPLIPGGNLISPGIGIEYNATKKAIVAAAYTHAFFLHDPIRQFGANQNRIVGNLSLSSNILNLQLIYNLN